MPITNFPSVLNSLNFACKSMLGVSKGKRCFQMETTIRGDSHFFYLSFPSAGGVRFHSGHTGFFESMGYSDIRYTELAENELALSPIDGQPIRVILSWNEDLWTLTFHNNGNEVLSIDNTMVLYGYDADSNHRNVRLNGKVREGEHFFGLGERFNKVFQNGERIPLWNVDCCQSPLTLSRQPGRPKTQGYKNVPLLHSSGGYSLFFNSTFSGIVDVGCYTPWEYSLEFAGRIFDVYFWMGTTREAINSYLQLTGKPLLPPRWALGFWAGGGIQVWHRNGRENAVETIRECLETYRKMGINISAIYAETSESHNPQTDLFDVLKEYGTRAMSWTNSRMGKAEDSRIRLEELEVKRKSDPSRNIPEDYIDFSHPRSRDVLIEHYAPLWEMGLRGSMIDYADNVAEDSKFYNGMTGDEMHNFYAYWYANTFHETWSSFLGEDFFLFSRCGCAGSQRWAGQFGGDMYATYPGLRQAVTAALTISTSGFSTWGSDIGGYFGAMPTPELYIRWLQFGTFSPLMRIHGMTERDPWHYGDEAVSVFKRYYWLRFSLLNFLYSGACAAHLQGDTLIRLLAVEYQDDPRFYEVDDQYLFGNELLVCPVLEENASSRRVIFPQGTWTSLWTGERITGGSEETIPAPHDEIPVYLRAGAVMPVCVSAQHSMMEDMNSEAIPAMVITPADSERTVTIYRDAETPVVLTITPTAGGMTISADMPIEEKTVLLYGVSSVEAMADGVAAAKTRLIDSDGPVRTVLQFMAAWRQLDLQFAI